jgi:hypothetical protein
MSQRILLAKPPEDISNAVYVRSACLLLEHGALGVRASAWAQLAHVA